MYIYINIYIRVAEKKEGGSLIYVYTLHVTYLHIHIYVLI